MYIVVGLGNPGREYAKTRHNIGFMAIDKLVDKYGAPNVKKAHRAIVGETRIAGERVVLAKPQTFMNLSGQSVVELMNWYKAEHSELVVICDDIDLPIGSIRIREHGSAGTHNGMRNIIYLLGYDDFTRIRVGIGAAGGEGNLISHVLGTPSDDDIKLLDAALDDVVGSVELICRGDVSKAQALYNKKGRTLKKERERAKEAAEEMRTEE